MLLLLKDEIEDAIIKIKISHLVRECQWQESCGELSRAEKKQATIYWHLNSKCTVQVCQHTKTVASQFQANMKFCAIEILCFFYYLNCCEGEKSRRLTTY